MNPGPTGTLQVTLWDKAGNLLESPTPPAPCNGVNAYSCISDPDGIGEPSSGGPIVDTLGQDIMVVEAEVLDFAPLGRKGKKVIAFETILRIEEGKTKRLR